MPSIPGRTQEDNEQSKMRILQLNINHCEAAHDLLMQTVREQKIDLVLISELYKHQNGQPLETDSTTKAVIWSCGKLPFQGVVNNGNAGFIAESYLPSGNSWGLQRLGSRLGQLTNARGKEVLEAFSTLDVVLLNSGDKPTYTKGDASSIVDLTFVSSSLIRGNYDWRMVDLYTVSDHNAILWEACDTCMLRKHGINQRPPVHWWNDHISSLWKECLKKRRISQRGYRQPNSADLVAEYKSAQRCLNKAIKDSKK
ncbi:hypothetical protein EVAR_35871_1 [Eumeta japonica]|uniref:Endonuclease/exonuclease/phosphatase domain-containing protein n=1 Tax=Eumeta variegata TaxID=151549 RepID=A0A4C1WUR4_EUMVA|nr:hypothetical protein EVAR_35871_1 [Eumeta japonica]